MVKVLIGDRSSWAKVEEDSESIYKGIWSRKRVGIIV